MKEDVKEFKEITNKDTVLSVLIHDCIRSDKNKIPNGDELIMYIIINKDLKMSIGKTAAQAAHSCTNYLINTMAGNNLFEKNKLSEWYNDCQKKIVLGAHQKNIEKLSKDSRFFPIYDKGLTEIPDGSLTAICLGIHRKDDIQDITKRFQLL